MKTDKIFRTFSVTALTLIMLALFLVSANQAFAGACFRISVGHHGHHHYRHHGYHGYHGHYRQYYYHPRHAHYYRYYDCPNCHRCDGDYEERQVEPEFRLLSVTTVESIENFEDGIQVSLANGMIVAIVQPGLSFPTGKTVDVYVLEYNGSRTYRVIIEEKEYAVERVQ